MEYVVVEHTERRDVHFDGIVVAKTNRMFAIDSGTYTIDLGEPRNYKPVSIERQVKDSSALEPVVVRFESRKAR